MISRRLVIRLLGGAVIAFALSPTPVTLAFSPEARNAKLDETQGNRISKDGQKAGKVGIVPAGSLDLAPERSFFGVFLRDVQGHVAENCQIVGAVFQTAS